MRHYQTIKGLLVIPCLIFLLAASTVSGRDPATIEPTKKKVVSQSTSSSKTLVWEANPAEQRISCYNVYQKIDNGRKPAYWKKIGTVREPKFTVRKLNRGSNVFAVSACNEFGEGPRSELVVTR